MGLITEVLLDNRPFGDNGSINDYLEITSDNGNDPVLSDFGLTGYPPTQYQVFIQNTPSVQPRLVWTCPDVNQAYNLVFKPHAVSSVAWLWYSDSSTPSSAIGPVKVYGGLNVDDRFSWFPKCNYVWATNSDSTRPQDLDPSGQTPVTVPGGHSFIGKMTLLDDSMSTTSQAANFVLFTSFDMNNLITGLKLYRKATAFTQSDHFDVSGATLLADVGVLAATTTTAAKTVPGYDTTFDLNVVSTSFRVIGDWVFIPGVGLFQITGVPSATKFSLKYLLRTTGPIDPNTGKLACDTNVSPQALITSGSRVISASYSDATQPAPGTSLFYRLIGVTPDFNYPDNDTSLAAGTTQPAGSTSWVKIGQVNTGQGVGAITGSVWDHAGNLVAVGYIQQGTLDFDGTILIGPCSFIAKYSPTGSLIYARNIAPGSNGSSVTTGMAVDSSNNIIVTGGFTAGMDFGGGYSFTDTINPTWGHGFGDIFLAKFNSSGAITWAKQFGSINGDGGNRVMVDSSNNIILVASFSGDATFGAGNNFTTTSSDIVVVKLNSSGTVTWAKQIGSSDTDNITDAAINSDGNIALTGTIGAALDLGGGSVAAGAFVAQFAGSNGAHQWSLGYAGSPGGLGIDPSTKDVYFSGSLSGSTNFSGHTVGPGGLFLTSYTSAGAFRWGLCFNNIYDGWSAADNGTSVSISTNGNVFFVGQLASRVSFDGNLGFQAKSFIASFSSAGVYRWATRLDGTGVTASLSSAADAAGNVISAGKFSGAVFFGSIQKTANLLGTAPFVADFVQ